MRKLILLIYVLFISILSYGQIIINEYSATNYDNYIDTYNNYEDWIELYNTGNTAIDLNGYYLSDKDNNPTKWQFTSIWIQPNDFLIIYCSKRDQIFAGNNVHTNFKLTQTKGNEYVVLSDPSGNILESILIEPTQTNHSTGRETNGAANWKIFTNPSPGNNNGGGIDGYEPTPIFDLQAGNYNNSINVNLSCANPNATIYYTTNGDFPDNTSTQYTGPININNTQVIKAISYGVNPNILPSFIETNTYFINESHTVNIVSISGNQVDNLLNGTGWLEPQGSFELFDSAFNFIDEGEGEFNKHGNDSWAYDQRGFDYITRDQFGYNHAIQNQIFRITERDKFQRLILKAGANDNYPFSYGGSGAHIRDAYCQSLSQVADLRMDERSFESCVLYLNGQYWGLYELREKIDDPDFTDYNYDQDEDDLDWIKTWGGTWIEYGDDTDWIAIRDFITSNNMSITANYNYAKSQYNVGSLIDYFILNAYVINADWLNWNTQWWRGRNPNGDKKKWRYGLWDQDNIFDHGTNYTGVPTQNVNADPCDPSTLGNPGGQGHVPILNALFQSESFFDDYINRWADLANTHFSCDFLIQHLDSLINIIEPEMNGQINRWGGNYNTWQNNVQDIRDFILTRCQIINDGIVDCFPDVTGPYDVALIIDGIGEVQISDIDVDNFTTPFNGIYFGGVNLPLEVENGNFSYWEIIADSSYIYDPFIDTLVLNLICDITIIAHFDAVDIVYIVEPPLSSDININGTIISNFPYTESYPNGTNINLTALPNVGWVMNNWQSNSSIFNPNNNVMTVDFDANNNDTIILNTQPDILNVTFTTNPINSGELNLNNIIISSFSHSVNYNYGEIININPVNNNNWEFEYWNSNHLINNGNTDYDLSLSITSNDTIILNFKEILYHNVTYNIKPSNSGEIEIDGELFSTFPITKQYREGEYIYMYTMPKNGFEFENWNSNNIQILPNSIQSGTYFECTNNDTITAIYNSLFNVFIPNSFSPNQDGDNEIFKPIVSYDISNYQYGLKIFDRWGNKIFQTTQYEVGWDGYNLENKKLPSGIYSYILYIINSDNPSYNINTSGKVTLLR